MSSNTEFIDKLKFSTKPSGKAEGKHHIVIVGAGIIGVCTAYYLTRHPSFNKDTHHITVIESKRVAGGASGKAGGLLAMWAFPQQIVPLSFQLHQELSDEYDGENKWDYRRLTTVSLEANVQDDNVSLDPRETGRSREEDDQEEQEQQPQEQQQQQPRKQRPKGKLPAKRKDKKICAVVNNDPVTRVGTTEDDEDYEYSYEEDEDEEEEDDDEEDDEGNENKVTGDSKRPDGDVSGGLDSKSSIALSKDPTQLPADLNWIKKHLVRDWSSLGGTDSTAQVHPYKFTHYLLLKAMESGAVDLILGKVSQLHFNDQCAASGISYIPTIDDPEEQLQQKPVDIMDVDQIVLSMGPWTSRLLPDCPISGLRAHSITIKPSTGTVSPYAIFTELKISQNKYFSPEMYARKDEVYVCGEGDTLVELPETSDAVEVVKEKCDELYHYVSKLSPNLSRGHILKRQACYLPVLNVPTSSGPLIGETNVEGLYIASGHSCWGINNAPGTGKVMSELLLEGEAKSADISALDPSLYFDASIFE
ncbi:UPF0673 membrane protein YHR009C [Kluyveromyces marxianus DMKU3-1042]|uniref:UPF0673 membrane protein YHR009C n=1 Tax=Kluyveromyces marxianus (strain DMKU3-1042 / BCC 29191 / NBRC 104275) TaxID=1003335 RepID=W0T7I4_KLUMD|nr:uncharacterized protein KLMA_20555 [Kluyveromyces marxianus DMKU3-1042]BAO39013.1 UPF0673 membrane protein YHR009C [Kluyveromyces marxianus DMKU3-1042]